MEVVHTLTLKRVWIKSTENGPAKACLEVVTDNPAAKANKKILRSDISPAVELFQLGDVYEVSAKNKAEKKLWMVGSDKNIVGLYEIRNIEHAKELHEELHNPRKAGLGMDPPSPTVVISYQQFRLAA